MNLRELKSQDAALMLEWMHDENVVSHLGTNFASKTIEDCRNFIAASQTDPDNLHLAITDDEDVYMGTVSLKHINKDSGTAEFAITICACAMGKGYSSFGMSTILKKGIEELGLTAIYWCVSQHNARAVRFYDKNGYTRTQAVPAHISQYYTENQHKDLIWYIFPSN